MPRFAANLSMMFTEWAFLDRFEAAADAGFEAVEYLFPYAVDADAIAERLQRHGLVQALFNAPPGNWEAGERGIAALPDRFEEFRAGIETAKDYVRATGVRRIHVMAGLASSTDAAAREAYRRALSHAAEEMAALDVEVLMEPINGRSMPGYFLNSFDDAAAVIAELGLPNLKLQFDIFHRQIMHGDVVEGLKKLLPISTHIQVASVPSRNEPCGEELNFPYIFEMLDALGYQGWIGCEYNPKAGTLEGLGWLDAYRKDEAAGRV